MGILEDMLKAITDIWSGPASPVTGSKYVADENAAAAKLFAADPDAPASGDPTLRDLYLLTPRWANFALDAASSFTDDFGQLSNPLSFYRDLIPSAHGLVMWQLPGLYRGVAWDDDGEGRLSLVFLGNKDSLGQPLNLGISVDWDSEEPDRYHSHRTLLPEEQVRSQQLRAFAYVVFYLLKNPDLTKVFDSRNRVAPKGGVQKYRAQFPTLSHDWLSSDGTAVVKSASLTSQADAAVGGSRGGSGGGGRPRYVFGVRGHWRDQWYPSLGLHRPKYIYPFLKGLHTGRTLDEVSTL